MNQATSPCPMEAGLPMQDGNEASSSESSTDEISTLAHCGDALETCSSTKLHPIAASIARRPRRYLLPMLACLAVGIGAADRSIAPRAPAHHEPAILNPASLDRRLERAKSNAVESRDPLKVIDSLNNDPTNPRTAHRIPSPSFTRLDTFHLSLVSYPSIAASSADEAEQSQGQEQEEEPMTRPVWQGFVTPLERALIPARESGVLIEVSIEPGKGVDENELIGRIDRSDEQRIAAMARAKLALAQARVDHRATRELALLDALQQETTFLESQVAGANDDPLAAETMQMRRLLLSPQRRALEETRLAQLDRELELEAALQSLEVETADQAIEQGDIRAPWRGIVTQQFRREGEWIVAGEAIAELVSFETLKVEVSLPLDEATASLVGKPCEVRVEGLGGVEHEFSGSIQRLGELIDANYELRMEVRFENRTEDDRWLAIPGSRASIRLVDCPVD